MALDISQVKSQVGALLKVLEDQSLETTGSPEEYIKAMESLRGDIDSRIRRSRAIRPRTSTGLEILVYGPDDFVDGRKCDECDKHTRRIVLAFDPDRAYCDPNGGNVDICEECAEDPAFDWRERED